MITLENLYPLAKITVDKYIRTVKTSKSQNPKYFYWDEVRTTIRAKGKPLFKKYIKKENTNAIAQRTGNRVWPQDLKDNIRIVGFKGTKPYCLVDRYIDSKAMLAISEMLDTLTTKQLKKPVKFFAVHYNSILKEVDYKKDRIISNPTQVNKAKKIVISGQGLYSGTYHEFERLKIVDALKAMYFKKFVTISPKTLNALRAKIADNYPIWVAIEIQDTIKKFNDKTKEGYGRAWDVNNLAYPYLKTFVDFLVQGYEGANVTIRPIIIDDDRLHVVGEGSFFTPITEEETHKIIFHIYADKRQFWKSVLKL